MIVADNKTIAKKIRTFRKQKKLTQKELADYLGLSKQIIYHIEKGKRYVLGEELFNIAETLGINIYDFGEWDNDK